MPTRSYTPDPRPERRRVDPEPTRPECFHGTPLPWRSVFAKDLPVSRREAVTLYPQWCQLCQIRLELEQQDRLYEKKLEKL